MLISPFGFFLLVLVLVKALSDIVDGSGDRYFVVVWLVKLSQKQW